MANDPIKESNTTTKKNIAYINITGDGNKSVGPIGLKKAEKDLILRRYKYNHQGGENMSRVALIYGNPTVGSAALSNVYNYKSNSDQYSNSPYISSSSQNNHNNVSSIIKRNKLLMENGSNQDSVSGYQIRLPRI